MENLLSNCQRIKSVTFLQNHASGFKSIFLIIKCANIFMFKSGRVKIGDMNVSKIIKGHLCSTQTGTPYYASP